MIDIIYMLYILKYTSNKFLKYIISLFLRNMAFLLVSFRYAIARSTLIFIADSNVISSGFRFYTKIILATSYEKVSIHTPSLAIRIPNYPILRASFLVSTPPNNNNRMIEIHPCNTVVLKISISQVFLFLYSNPNT